MLITDDYRSQLREMHTANQFIGMPMGQKADLVREASLWGRRRILDYGCGKQTLAQALGPAYKVTGYDPAVEGCETPPDPHPVVVCADVLEHIEPDCLPDVLRDLRRVTQQTALLFISCVPAEKTLPDGRNAHLIQQPKEWWLEKLRAAGFHATREGDGVGSDGKIVGCWMECCPC